MKAEQKIECKKLCEMKQLLHPSRAKKLLGSNDPRVPPDSSSNFLMKSMVTIGFDLKDERITFPLPSPLESQPNHQHLPHP